MAIKKTYEVQTLVGITWKTTWECETEEQARAAVALRERNLPGQSHRYRLILAR